MDNYGKVFGKAQPLVDKLNTALAKKGVDTVSLTVNGKEEVFTKARSREIQRFIQRYYKTMEAEVLKLMVIPTRKSAPQSGPKPVSQLVKLIRPTPVLTNFVNQFFPSAAGFSNIGTGQWYQTLLRRYLNENNYFNVVDKKNMYYLPAGALRNALAGVTDSSGSAVNLDSFQAPKVPTLISRLLEKNAAGKQDVVESTSAAGAEAFTRYRQLFTARKQQVEADKVNVGRDGLDPSRRDVNKSDIVTTPDDYTQAAYEAGVIDVNGQAVDLGDANNISFTAYQQDLDRAFDTAERNAAKKASKEARA